MLEESLVPTGSAIFAPVLRPVLASAIAATAARGVARSVGANRLLGGNHGNECVKGNAAEAISLVVIPESSKRRRSNPHTVAHTRARTHHTTRSTERTKSPPRPTSSVLPSRRRNKGSRQHAVVAMAGAARPPMGCPNSSFTPGVLGPVVRDLYTCAVGE